jgi:hypothetical protein
VVAVTGDLARYRFISTLGAGGMATVTLAEDTRLGRQVALKRMAGAVDPRGLSRLRREALAGASVSHPNLVSVYDVVAAPDGDLVIVMEYVRGETLRDALSRRPRFAAAEALRILDGVAAGLDAIHRQGIVHRDVKPSNILLGADGSIKIADLGIASVPERTRITTAGSVLGSLSYMAPEQLDDAPSTPGIDIYALAAVSFEMLAGEKARRESNPVALAHAISTQPPPDLRTAWPPAPRAAADVLNRAMSRELDERPRSAAELTARLRAALAQPDLAPRTGPRPGPRTGPRPGPRTGPRPVPLPAGPPAPASRSGRPAPPGGRRLPRRRLVAGLLSLVVVAVGLAVVLNGGGSRPHHAARTFAGRRRRPTPAAPGAARATTTATAAGRTTAAAGAPGTTTATAGVPGTTTAVATAPSAASPAAAGTPVSAVESFYGLAASHRYADAWALADPTFQGQLGGYRRFQADQAGDRSIGFDSAQTISRSSSSATVAVRTTSVRDDGTHHCAGTVELRAGASSRGWLVHLIHISCT